MSIESRYRGLSRGNRRAAVAGVALLVLAVAAQSWFVGLVAAGLLIWVSSKSRAADTTPDDLRPFPLPPEFRSLAEAMARPIDPTPKRVLPPDEKSAGIAAVATTPQTLSTLIADKPPGWPWAVFTSVLVQRRNALQSRLRAVASGYQPAPGRAPITGLEYARIAEETMQSTLDVLAQLEQFMRSPAFTGAFGSTDHDADAEAISGVAHRLMDYHETFLARAERCLQTPVERDAIAFAHDLGSFALCPLLGYERFIPTMCDRIGQAQDLLPYTEPDTVVALDDVTLVMDVPDGLAGRITEHVRRVLP